MALEELEQLTPDQITTCELFTLVPDRSNPVAMVPILGVDTIKLGNSIPQVDINKEVYNAMTFSFEYILSGIDDLVYLQDFFNDKLGRNKSFCLPSWNADFVLSAAITTASAVIHVAEMTANIYAGMNLFFYVGGSYFTRKVLSFNDVALTITLDSNVAVNMSSGQGVSIVYRVSFSDDILSFNFETSTVAKVTIGFTEERREPTQEGETIS